MSDQDLERRLTRWLHGAAPEGAPSRLRSRAMAVPRTLPVRRGWRLTTGRVPAFLVAAGVVLAAIVTLAVARPLWLHDPLAGSLAAGCDERRVEDVRAAFRSLESYTYRAQGTYRGFAGSGGGGAAATSWPVVTEASYEGAYQAPDRRLQRYAFPPLPGATEEVIEVGDRRWRKLSTDVAWTEEAPDPGVTLRPHPDRLVLDPALAWHAATESDIPGSGDCVLIGTRSEEVRFEPAASAVGSHEIRVTMRLERGTELPTALRYEFDVVSETLRETGSRYEYEIDTDERVQIDVPSETSDVTDADAVASLEADGRTDVRITHRQLVTDGVMAFLWQTRDEHGYVVFEDGRRTLSGSLGSGPSPAADVIAYENDDRPLYLFGPVPDPTVTTLEITFEGGERRTFAISSPAFVVEVPDPWRIITLWRMIDGAGDVLYSGATPAR